MRQGRSQYTIFIFLIRLKEQSAQCTFFFKLHTSGICYTEVVLSSFFVCALVHACKCMCRCVRVCVCEREKEREIRRWCAGLYSFLFFDM